jgi:formate dehydrogenase major subunit
MTNTIACVEEADVILITGSNTTENHPVISAGVKRAVSSGRARLIVVDPRRIKVAEFADCYLRPNLGTDVAWINGMLNVIISENLQDAAFVAERTEAFEEMKALVAKYTPDYVESITGIPAAQLIEAARLYAKAKVGNIIYCMGITQHTCGTDNVKSLANLAMLCGNLGMRGGGVNPLRGQNNVQGACDMGGLVNVYPGYQHVTDEKKRGKIAEAWHVDSLPGKVGLTVVEAMHAVGEGKIKAQYVMGENPMMSDPDTTHVEQALRSLDFLVVQDIFLSDTAQLAHVVLPAASSLEKDGTFTNTERRVQMIQPVLPAPGLARSDWRITAEIAARFDQKMGIEREAGYWHYDSSADIFDEMTAVTPIYHGMSFERLKGNGLQWPCPTEDHPGTAILHSEKFSRGLGLFSPVRANDPVEQADDEYPLILSTGRVLYHYHSGTMTRRSAPLAWRDPGGYIEVNEVDAAAARVEDGDAVVLKSRRGSVHARLKVSEKVPPGTVFLAFHWREAPANRLTHDIALDPIAKIPEYKISAVRLESSFQ